MEIFRKCHLTYLDKWEAINKVDNEYLERNIYASRRGKKEGLMAFFC